VLTRGGARARVAVVLAPGRDRCRMEFLQRFPVGCDEGEVDRSAFADVQPELRHTRLAEARRVCLWIVRLQPIAERGERRLVEPDAAGELGNGDSDMIEYSWNLLLRTHTLSMPDLAWRITLLPIAAPPRQDPVNLPRTAARASLRSIPPINSSLYRVCPWRTAATTASINGRSSNSFAAEVLPTRPLIRNVACRAMASASSAGHRGKSLRIPSAIDHASASSSTARRPASRSLRRTRTSASARHSDSAFTTGRAAHSRPMTARD